MCLRTIRKWCASRPTPTNLSKRHSLESKLHQLMTNAKLRFEQNLSMQSSSKIFKYIKSLSSSASVPPIVSLDSSTATNDYQKISMFNSFFHSVFTQSSFQILPLDDLPTPISELSDISISEMDVFEALHWIHLRLWLLTELVRKF